MHTNKNIMWVSTELLAEWFVQNGSTSGRRAVISAASFRTIVWILGKIAIIRRVAQQKFTFSIAECSRCSNSCHSPYAHCASVTFGKPIFFEWRWDSVYSLRVIAAHAIRNDAWMPVGDSSRVLSSLCVWMRIVPPFFNGWISRCRCWGDGGAPFACHARGTYVVENFDEMFMLKLKTLSPSTAGIKDSPIVIYFFACSYLGLGAELQNTCVRTIRQMCFFVQTPNTSFIGRCQRSAHTHSRQSSFAVEQANQAVWSKMKSIRCGDNNLVLNRHKNGQT